MYLGLFNVNLFPNGTLLLPNQYTAKKTANVQIARQEKCELRDLLITAMMATLRWKASAEDLADYIA